MKKIEYIFQNITHQSYNRLQCINWWKNFFDASVKNKEEAYEKTMSISKNNDYTTSNSIDYEYYSKCYKLIAKDLSKKIELENPDLRQQINFVCKLEDDRATMFFIIEKSEETTFEFSQNSVNIIKNGNTNDHKLVK